MIKRVFLATLLAGITAGPAHAEPPGLADKVYPARLEPGVTEFEARFGRLTGGEEHGETGLLYELAHSFSKRWYGGVELEFEREAEGRLQAEEIGLEGLYSLGRLPTVGVDIGIFAEVGIPVRGGPIGFSTRLLLQKSVGDFDSRFNLRVDRSTGSDERFAFGYEASADYAVYEDEVRLGVEAFGSLGDTRRFGRGEGHFIGPVAKFEIEHLPGCSELGINSGYLFAVGAAREEAKGQVRVLLEWEARF